MGVYVVRRTAIFLLSMVVASVLVFVVLSVLPGDPAQVILGTQATEESLASLRAELGLDDPLWVQYGRWASGAVRGDFGESPISGQDISTAVAERLAVTGPLVLMGMVLALLIAVPLGILAAMRHGRPAGTVISGFSQVGIAVPSFWAGILLITLVAVKLRWLPSGGFTPWDEDPGEAFRSLILPAVSIAIVQAAILTRYVRSAILDVMRQDYIRTARAKGLSQRRALWRHGLRNAAVPLATIIGVQLTFLLVGAVVIENVFFLPGIGRQLLQSIKGRDLFLVQGIVMTLTAVVLFVNFLVDVSYRLIDPRMRAST